MKTNKTQYVPMRVEGKTAHPLNEPVPDHDRALACAVSVAKFPMDVDLKDVRYLVYRDGRPCDCSTCAVFAKERLFNINVCRYCLLEKKDPGRTARNVEAVKAFAEGRKARRVRVVYEPF